MPSGLSDSDRYIYLAQKLTSGYLSEQSHGSDGGFVLLVASDGKNERFAETFRTLCEKANLYCTVSGSLNIIKIKGERTEVGVGNSCRCKFGSDEWINTFFKNS